MSNVVTVNIEAPNNMLLEGAELPDDYTVEEVINELVDSLELSRMSENGAYVEYTLYFVNRQQNLTPHQTIGGAGIRDYDTLRLKAPQDVYMPEPPPHRQPTLNPTLLPQDEVMVVLSVLDINKHETVTLSTVRSVGDLIRQIIQNYNLAPRDKLGQLIKYRLQSKALGRFLEETVTLSQVNIPTLDRLTLHREEIAGA